MAVRNFNDAEKQKLIQITGFTGTRRGRRSQGWIERHSESDIRRA
jgi:hypothetical protein